MSTSSIWIAVVLFGCFLLGNFVFLELGAVGTFETPLVNKQLLILDFFWC